MDVVEELEDPQVPIAQACAALGLSRATLYRYFSNKVTILAELTNRAVIAAAPRLARK